MTIISTNERIRYAISEHQKFAISNIRNDRAGIVKIQIGDPIHLEIGMPNGSLNIEPMQKYI